MVVVKLWYRFTGVLLKSLYKVIYGKSVHWGKSLHFRKGLQLTARWVAPLPIGDNVLSFQQRLRGACIKEVRIGSETIFGENVRVYDHNHRFADEKEAIKGQGYSTRRW